MLRRALLLAAWLLEVERASSWSPGGFPNQLGTTPPRGWRSWLAFQQEADQASMEAAMTALHLRRPLGKRGRMVSLQDLGYSDIGLDGGWARCDGLNSSYHDSSGRLLINATKFPSMATMNQHAHALGLTSSWYLNCDQCGSENRLTASAATEAWYDSDARTAARLAYDGIKFDTQPGGPNWNITKWAIAVNGTGRPMVIEDCLDKHPDGQPLKRSVHPSIDILHQPERATSLETAVNCADAKLHKLNLQGNCVESPC